MNLSVCEINSLMAIEANNDKIQRVCSDKNGILFMVRAQL